MIHSCCRYLIQWFYKGMTSLIERHQIFPLKLLLCVVLSCYLSPPISHSLHLLVCWNVEWFVLVRMIVGSCGAHLEIISHWDSSWMGFVWPSENFQRFLGFFPSSKVGHLCTFLIDLGLFLSAPSKILDSWSCVLKCHL